MWGGRGTLIKLSRYQTPSLAIEYFLIKIYALLSVTFVLLIFTKFIPDKKKVFLIGKGGN